MKIKLLVPIVKPLYSSYRTLNGLVRIYVGFTSENGNINNIYDRRQWTLKNGDNLVIDSGSVNVKYNTFDAYVDVSELVINKAYTFSISNPDFIWRSAIIITIATMSDVIAVDETTIFSEPLSLFGDITLYNTNQVRLIPDWSITRTDGNGIIKGKNSGRWFAYYPTAIYTRNRDVGETIPYTPITGKAEIDVPIKQLMDVRWAGNYRYEITPASKVRVDFSYYDKAGLKISKVYYSTIEVDSINLRNVDDKIRGEASVKIMQMF